MGIASESLISNDSPQLVRADASPNLQISPAAFFIFQLSVMSASPVLVPPNAETCAHHGPKYSDAGGIGLALPQYCDVPSSWNISGTKAESGPHWSGSARSKWATSLSGELMTPIISSLQQQSICPMSLYPCKNGD